jgi:hypothetical protein
MFQVNMDMNMNDAAACSSALVADAAETQLMHVMKVAGSICTHDCAVDGFNCS